MLTTCRHLCFLRASFSSAEPAESAHLGGGISTNSSNSFSFLRATPPSHPTWLTQSHNPPESDGKSGKEQPAVGNVNGARSNAVSSTRPMPSVPRASAEVRNVSPRMFWMRRAMGIRRRSKMSFLLDLSVFVLALFVVLLLRLPPGVPEMLQLHQRQTNSHKGLPSSCTPVYHPGRIWKSFPKWPLMFRSPFSPSLPDPTQRSRGGKMRPAHCWRGQVLTAIQFSWHDIYFE